MRPAIGVIAGLASAAVFAIAATGWQVPDADRWPLIGVAIVLALIAGWAAFKANARREPSLAGAKTGATKAVAQAASQAGQGNTLTQVAGNQINYPLPAHPDEFADAPHLMWSGIQVLSLEGAFELTISCNNVGRTAQLIPEETWVQSTVDVLGPPIAGTMPVQAPVTQEPEDIEFFSFDKGGHISPGAFNLHMQCRENDPIPGDREVRWRLMYMDDDLRRGYITECSVVVSFVGMGAPRIIGEPSYDRTTRRQRNEDYNRYMADKGALSTGPRRSHDGRQRS